MEIKEEHLQTVFDEIEERAIKNGRKGVEFDVTVSVAWSMRTKLLAVLRSKSEDDLALTKMIGKDFAEMLERCNGNIISLRYTCGHGIDLPKIYSLAGSVGNYIEWGNDVEGLCVECWTKKKRRRETTVEYK